MKKITGAILILVSVQAYAQDESVNGDLTIGKSGNAGNLKIRRGSDGNINGWLGFLGGGAERHNLALQSTSGGGYLTFRTNYDGSIAERMRISNNGKVGIGVDDPSEELEVHVGDAFSEILISSERNGNGENLGRIGFEGLNTSGASVKYAGVKGGILDNSSSTYQGNLFFETYDDGFNPRMTIAGSNIGIGTTQPDFNLDVRGTVAIGSSGDAGVLNFRRGSDGWSGAANIGFNGASEAHNFSFKIISGSGYLTFYTNKNGSVDERMRLLNNGSLGIGTTSTGNHKLAVEGSIGAREIKVEANGWSDFVFKKEYELRTLEEVEQHIKENGHLPEIPSEVEVVENGINLGEMNAKLLQKIEELTLYLIDEHKNNQKLQQEVEQLKKEVSALKQIKDH